MTEANAKILEKIYDAIGGLVSEMDDPFDHFYKGGTEKMRKDFEKVLSDECGITFVDPVYSTVQDKSGTWNIVDQTGNVVLSGMKSKEEAEETLKDVLNFKESA